MVNYDAIAGNYDADRQVSSRVVSQVIEHLGDYAIHDILEIGTGTANYLLALSVALMASGHGLDLSMSMLERGRRKNSALNLVQANAGGPFPYSDANFDFVYSVDFIHYLGELPGLFAEMFRVLRPGGSLLTVTDSHDDIRKRTQTKYFPETFEVEIQRYHPISVITSAMGRAGFISAALSHTEHTFVMDERHLAMYRNKAFSMLRLISEEAFQAGLARLTADIQLGNCVGSGLYTYVWGSKPFGSD